LLQGGLSTRYCCWRSYRCWHPFTVVGYLWFDSVSVVAIVPNVADIFAITGVPANAVAGSSNIKLSDSPKG
jgi:hypothetical protein